MLILAGVSLNAIIGDNGIITNAQIANLKSGMAALEEFLQEKYIEYYDETENYSNKIEMLSDKIPNLLLTGSSTRKYVIYSGKAYYLINKQSLPDEIKQGLSGGNSIEKADYTKLIDVYGVTPDLKVYYIDKNGGGEYGTVDNTLVDSNAKAVLLNNSNNSAIHDAIVQALKDIGVKIDPELGLTLGNLSQLKSLTLDGSTANITSLAALQEATALQELTLKNLTLDNLNGIDSLAVLNYLYLYNCNIKDYSKLTASYNLKYLYMHFLSSMSEETTNSQITALGNALKDAQKLNKLQYFGAYGVNLNNSMTYPWWYEAPHGAFYSGFTSGTRSNLSDISGLANFADNIKKSIKYLYLNNNKLNSINALNEFTAVTQLLLMCNSPLTNLNGLENHTDLVWLAAHSCGLTSIEGLNGTTSLYGVFLQDNKLTSLSGIRTSTGLYTLSAYSNQLTDIEAIDTLTNMRILYLNNNPNLQNVEVIAKCTNIVRLYLDSNNNMVASQVAKLDSILNRCGLNYSIPQKYLLQLPNLISYNYSNYGLTDSSTEVSNLEGNTAITRLNLSGNTNLSNTKLNNVLKTLTGLKYLSLNGIGNLTSIDFIKNVPNLIELDLRGTNVTSNTDIALLNTYGTHLVNLIINNASIKLEDIETTLVNVNKNWTTSGLDSWIHSGAEYCRGAICLSSSYDFSKLTKLTAWRCWQLNANGSNHLDLSNCSNLTTVSIYSNCSYKLPASVTSLTIGNGSPTFNLALCNNLTSITTSNTHGAYVVNACKTLPNDNKLSTLSTYIYGSTYTTLDFLGEFNASHLTYLRMVGYSQGTNGLRDIKGLQYAPNITYLEITNSSVGSLEGIQYLTNLETLIASNTFTKISDISYLSNLTKLKNITLSGQRISSIPDLSKCTQLETLTLSSNYISDLAPLSKLITNGSTSLRTLNLSNNSIEEYSLTGTDNISILKQLKEAGATTINVSGNNFEDDPEI